MRKEIHIGEKTINLVASATTDCLYFEVFRKDFRLELQKFGKLKDKKQVEYSEDDYSVYYEQMQAFTRMAYIMALEGENKSTHDITNSTKEDFYEWLRQFEPRAFEDIEVLSTITELYKENGKGTIKPKNA